MISGTKKWSFTNTYYCVRCTKNTEPAEIFLLLLRDDLLSSVEIVNKEMHIAGRTIHVQAYSVLRQT